MSATLVPPVVPVPAAPVPATTRAAPPVAPPRERLLSLDVFRGITVAAMLLVNDPGSWEHIYPPLEHAPWNGWTPTDLIFPFFLFIVGITTQLSLGARRAAGADEAAITRQIVRRGALIFLFGLLLNWFPFVQWGELKGVADPTVLQRVLYRLEHLRIMGVLQRIGLAYAAAGLITMRTTLKQQVIILAVLLYGYWWAMTLLPVPGSGGVQGMYVLGRPGLTLDAWVDRTLLRPDHLWVGGNRVRDPEGLFSTVPAIGTAMLSNFAGRWIGERERSLAERINGLYAAGTIAIMGGLMWHWVFPINKSLWTSSFVLFTAGMACIALATCMWVIDAQRVAGWTRPFAIYGTNPMIAFVGSGVLARCIYSIFHVQIDGERTSLVDAFYDKVLTRWLEPRDASLAFALLFVGFWYVVLAWCWKRKIIFRV
ncbi:MAG TPA: DUF5009 domain-containing protein [Gemmatirosa sp.]